MDRFTLTLKNSILEDLYTNREIPSQTKWIQKMSGVVILISVVSIVFTIMAKVESSKPYIAQLIFGGSALITIILLNARASLLNYVHTANCTIYMVTMIWTYTDTDFYRDPQSDFLNGYIQGMATYVYISGTKFIPKLFLITLLFVNMSFCNGVSLFVSHFIQVTPLWLLFIYRVYFEERLNRQLFLSQQQEHVYKYIIQNVLPNGLILVKYDQKFERIELHSSNQKPKTLGTIRNSDDMRHIVKNTVLAKDETTLHHLAKTKKFTWADTLEGHLRRKIDQTLLWGEKRFIRLKDRNTIRNKETSLSQSQRNDFDFNQAAGTIANSVLSNSILDAPRSHRQTFTNPADLEFPTAVYSYNQYRHTQQYKSQQNPQTSQQQQQFQYPKKLHKQFSYQSNQFNSGHNLTQRSATAAGSQHQINLEQIIQNNKRTTNPAITQSPFVNPYFSMSPVLNQNSNQIIRQKKRTLSQNQTHNQNNPNNSMYAQQNRPQSINQKKPNQKKSNRTPQQQQQQQPQYILPTQTSSSNKITNFNRLFSPSTASQANIFDAAGNLIGAGGVGIGGIPESGLSSSQAIYDNNFPSINCKRVFGQKEPQSALKHTNFHYLQPNSNQINTNVAAIPDILENAIPIKKTAAFADSVPQDNPITDLVECFSAAYLKSDETMHMLNLRLSTFYLNEIYGVISIEDESYKQRYQTKSRHLAIFQKIFERSQRDLNNLIVNFMYWLSQHAQDLSKSRYQLFFEVCKIQNKLDLQIQMFQSITSISSLPTRISIEECTEYLLYQDLKPFIEFSKQRAADYGILFSCQLIGNENILVITQKQLVSILFQSILLNAMEATPQKGSIAVTIESVKETQQIKFQLTNSTLGRLDQSSFSRFEDDITLDNLMEDIQNLDRTQLGVRVARRILQKIGPTDQIEFVSEFSEDSQLHHFPHYSFHLDNNYNNNISNESNGGSATLAGQYQQQQQHNQQQNQQFGNLQQTFYIYSDIRSLIGQSEPNVPTSAAAGKSPKAKKRDDIAIWNVPLVHSYRKKKSLDVIQTNLCNNSTKTMNQKMLSKTESDDARNQYKLRNNDFVLSSSEIYCEPNNNNNNNNNNENNSDSIGEQNNVSSQEGNSKLPFDFQIAFK